MVFDTCNPCFEETKDRYYQEIEKFQVNKDTPLILVGGQIDKRNIKNKDTRKNDLDNASEKPMSFKRGLTAAKELGAVSYLECSSRLGIGLKELEEEIFRILLNSSKPLEHIR